MAIYRACCVMYNPITVLTQLHIQLHITRHFVPFLLQTSRELSFSAPACLPLLNSCFRANLFISVMNQQDSKEYSSYVCRRFCHDATVWVFLPTYRTSSVSFQRQFAWHYHLSRRTTKVKLTFAALLFWALQLNSNVLEVTSVYLL